MREKSIKANVLLNIIRLMSSILLPMISYPYISRVLGPVPLGKVDFAASIVNYFAIIAGLGIPSYGVICCSKVRNDKKQLKKTVSELFVINFVLTFIAYLVLFIVIAAVPAFQSKQKEILIYSITLFCTTLGIDWLYSALEEFKYITVRSIVFKVISVALMLLLVRNPNDYIIYECILIFSTVGSNVLNFIHARRFIDFSGLKFNDLKKHFTPILMFASASIASTINANTDTAMLGLLRDDYEVGLYGFSVKFKNLLINVNNAALTVMVPRLSYFVGQHDKKQYDVLLKKATDSVMAIACGIPIFFCVFASETIKIIGGDNYLDAAGTMIVLNLCVIVLGATWIMGVGVLQTFGRQNLYAKTMWLAVIVNIGVNMLLIPRLGAMGAALATLITETFNAGMFYYYSKDIIRGNIRWISYGKLLVIALAGSLVIRYFVTYIRVGVFVKLIVAAICYGLIYGGAVLILLPNARSIVLQMFDAFLKKVKG